jgi:copper homeostasis protein CutC
MKEFKSAFKVVKPESKQTETKIETVLDGLQQQSNMVQGVVKQLISNQQYMVADINRAVNMSTDLQYQIAAITSLLGIDLTEIDKKVEEMKIKDFNNAVERENKQKNLVPVDLIDKESIVILTSTTPDEIHNAGIFRTRFKIGESGNEQLEEVLIGKKVGDSFEMNFNNTMHNFTILDVSKQFKQEVPVI